MQRIRTFRAIEMLLTVAKGTPIRRQFRRQLENYSHKKERAVAPVRNHPLRGRGETRPGSATHTDRPTAY